MNKFKLYMHDNKESVIILLTFLQVLLFLFCSTIKEEKDIKEMPVVMTKVNLLYSDVFNELIDRIYVYKEDNKKIKLDIYIKTGESINTFSDNLGRKFHLTDNYTTSTCC